MIKRASPAEIKRNMEYYKYTVVKRYIDERDAVHLLELCCPPDEYDIETKAICGLITRDSSIEQIAEVIASVFNQYFDEMFDSTDFMTTAKKIKASI